MRLIATDLRLFGFPVMFDPLMAQHVIELRNPKGQRITITLVKLVDEFNAFDPQICRDE